MKNGSVFEPLDADSGQLRGERRKHKVQRAAHLPSHQQDGDSELPEHAFQGGAKSGAGLQVGLDLLVARPFLVAEPFIGYQVYGNEQAIKDVTNKLDWGFGLGIGADVLNHVQLRIEWFKNLGALADASKQAAIDALKDTNYQGIKITAGLFF